MILWSGTVYWFVRDIFKTLKWFLGELQADPDQRLRKANLIIEIGDAKSIINRRPLLPESSDKGLVDSRRTIG